MKKGKLNLDKKSIAKLSEENLENVQGGEAQFLSLWKCNCTNITVIETEAPAEAQSLVPADIVLSCKV